MRWALVVAMLVAGACTPAPPEEGGEADAAQGLWSEALGQSGPAPEVRFVAPDPACASRGTANLEGGERCLADLFLPESGLTVVRVPGDLLSQTALGHGLLHAALYAETGDPDPGSDCVVGRIPVCSSHMAPDWRAGGRITAAGAWLAERGL